MFDKLLAITQVKMTRASDTYHGPYSTFIGASDQSNEIHRD